MRRVVLLAFVAMMAVQGFAQRDKVILRDGSVKEEVKMDVMSNDSTVFIHEGQRIALPNYEIYMVKQDKRGNVFFTEDGEQFTGEGDGKVPGSATAIYLTKGQEVIAYNVSITPDDVTYQLGKKKSSPKVTQSKDEIFMICYQDGSRMLITEFASLEEHRRMAAEEARLAALRARYPLDGTILTASGKRLSVTVISEDDTDYMFKHRDNPNGPVFHIKKENVKDINLM